MTREEQIKQAAVEDCGYYANNRGYHSFVAGVAWADEHPKSPWQPVSPDNLPTVGSKFLVVSDTGHIKVCCMPDKKIYGSENLLMNSYLGGMWDENGLPMICASEGTRWTHWMPIPKFEEE